MDEKILSILEELCGTDEVRNDRDINLFEEELLDSLGLIELLIQIEETFGIKLEPTEVQREDIETPNKLIEYLKKRSLS